MKNWLGIILIIFFVSCNEAKRDNSGNLTWTSLPLKYAKGFTIEQSDDLFRVKLLKPYKEAKVELTYLFYPATKPSPTLKADALVATPVEALVCTSTTHIPLLDYLNETNALVGFPTTDYISSKAMRKRVNLGKVSELGIDDALNLEKLIALRPDLVMAYSLSGDLGQYKLIEEAGIPVILNSEYLEPHPLGRAEWLKLAGIIFGKTQEADSIFNKIEREYLVTRQRVQELTAHPTTISGVIYGDSWYLPGGKNYASTLLKDAGFNFFWQNDTTSAFLPMSFETVFDKGRAADYWIGVASFNTLSEMSAGDERYTNFKAFKNGNVYSYNKLIGEKGGSEFLELGYLRPDLILKDLVKIGHPELIPEHQLFFHFRLP